MNSQQFEGREHRHHRGLGPDTTGMRHRHGPFAHDDEDRRHRHGGPEGRGRGGRQRGEGPFGEGGPFREGHRGPRRHGGGNRAQRGDVRAAVLLLLEQEPMHGYQLIQEIATRTQDGWKPSPGAIYPTISLLEDEEFVTLSRDGARQLVSLTDAGKAYIEENRETLGDPFSDRVRTGAPALRDLVGELHVAVRQVAQSGSETQIEATREALTQVRRAIYLILAGD